MRHALLLASTLALAPFASADPGSATARRDALLLPCAGCHGTEGASASPEVPHLDGQLAAYLEESIDLLGRGKRKSAVADHVPATWTAADVRIVAEFYSRNKGRREVEEVDADRAAAGREIFLERCETCHESSGRETDSRGAAVPILAGQRMRYLAGQLRAYLDGERMFLLPMKQAAFIGKPVVVAGQAVGEQGERISRADIEALAAFLAGVRPLEEKKRRRSLR